MGGERDLFSVEDDFECDEAGFGKIEGITCPTPRWDSHSLEHSMLATGTKGSPLEYVYPQHITKQEELVVVTEVGAALPDALWRTKPIGCFAATVHCYQLHLVGIRDFATTSPGGSGFIMIESKDTGAQAISLVRTEHSQVRIPAYEPRRPAHSCQAMIDAVLSVIDGDSQRIPMSNRLS